MTLFLRRGLVLGLLAGLGAASHAGAEPAGGYGGYGGAAGWGGAGAGAGAGGAVRPPAPAPVQPYVYVPYEATQPAPMPPGAPMIQPGEVQALVGGAGYAQVTAPQFSQGYYYVKATSAAGEVLLAVDAYSGQIVSSRPVASTPRPPVVESGSLIGSGSLVGTPPPTVPRGPLAPDPNNPGGDLDE